MQSTNLVQKIDALKNTGDIIAQSLKEMIYEGSLKPGESLRQDAIAELFGVSRVPVRDALNKLVAMQLALNVPRKGIVVHPLSKKLLRELFDVRVILEGAAAEKILDNSTPVLVESLSKIIAEQKKALKAKDVKENEVLDDKFHRLVRSYINNQTLSDMIDANWMRIKQARCASSMVLPESGEAWIKNSIIRHERLFSAIKVLDYSSVRQVVTKNITESYEEVISTLEKMGWLDEDSLK